MTLPTKGWANVTLGECTDAIQYGLTCTSNSEGNGFRYIRITDIQDRQIDWQSVPFANETVEKAGAYEVSPNDILFARTGATVGKSFLITALPYRAAFASYLIRVRCTNGLITPRFGAWFFQSPEYWNQIYEGAEGTGQPNFNGSKLSSLSFALPPLAEQRRIVAKLDALTTRLARARAELDRVSILANRLRETGLETAFSGQLTAKVTRQNGALPPEWRTVRFDEAAEIASNLVPPKTILDLPHIAPNHIESGRPKLLPYKTIKEDEVISGKHHFFPGQLLYSKIRPYLRKIVQVDFEGGCSADMYPINPKCHPRYLMYWMLSPQFTWLATRHEGRTVLPKINQNALNTIPTPLAPSSVQALIANQLDEIFARADRLEAEAVRSRKLLDRLESAILAKAFRGELVPQDPNDEPASALLDRIRAQRAAGGAKPARGRRKAG